MRLSACACPHASACIRMRLSVRACPSSLRMSPHALGGGRAAGPGGAPDVVQQRVGGLVAVDAARECEEHARHGDHHLAGDEEVLRRARLLAVAQAPHVDQDGAHDGLPEGEEHHAPAAPWPQRRRSVTAASPTGANRFHRCKEVRKCAKRVRICAKRCAKVRKGAKRCEKVRLCLCKDHSQMRARSLACIAPSLHRCATQHRSTAASLASIRRRIAASHYTTLRKDGGGEGPDDSGERSQAGRKGPGRKITGKKGRQEKCRI